jgi:hypothetical protein
LTWISGRNDAGQTLCEVGATRMTDRGSSSSGWTITPKRLPRCSRPRPFGNRPLGDAHTGHGPRASEREPS